MQADHGEWFGWNVEEEKHAAPHQPGGGGCLLLHAAPSWSLIKNGFIQTYSVTQPRDWSTEGSSVPPNFRRPLDLLENTDGRVSIATIYHQA